MLADVQQWQRLQNWVSISESKTRGKQCVVERNNQVVYRLQAKPVEQPKTNHRSNDVATDMFLAEQYAQIRFNLVRWKLGCNTLNLGGNVCNVLSKKH